MPDLPSLLTFIAAAFVVVLVPGITVSGVVSASLARGLVAGLWVEAGAQFGRLTMVAIVALALGTVIDLVTAAFDIIKFLGAAYLIYVGIGYLTSRGGLNLDRPVASRTPLQHIGNGFLILWSNPKAPLFFGAFLPQFVDPDFPAAPQVLLLGLIEMGAALITDTAYILIAAYARSALGAERLRYLNRAAGLVLIGAAVWLVLQRQG